MERFAIIATPKYMGKGFVAMEVLGHEACIREAMRIFRQGTMHKVVVVNEAIEIVFKDQRRCKCTNVQRSFAIVYGNQEQMVEQCMDCKIVINHEGWRPQVAVEAPVEEEALVG